MWSDQDKFDVKITPRWRVCSTRGTRTESRVETGREGSLLRPFRSVSNICEDFAALKVVSQHFAHSLIVRKSSWTLQVHWPVEKNVHRSCRWVSPANKKSQSLFRPCHSSCCTRLKNVRTYEQNSWKLLVYNIRWGMSVYHSENLIYFEVGLWLGTRMAHALNGQTFNKMVDSCTIF